MLKLIPGLRRTFSDDLEKVLAEKLATEALVLHRSNPILFLRKQLRDPDRQCTRHVVRLAIAEVTKRRGGRGH